MSLAQMFLAAVGALFVVAFAVPLLFAPDAWARVFQWRDPSSGLSRYSAAR